MNDFTYSITMPHYNSIELLKRMLKSVPEREDIQIIVVDDFSFPCVQEQLLLLKHKNLEIYYQSSNQGAANARNAACKYARGKWLLAVDCDDMFAEGAFDILDKYKDLEIDYISYCVSCRDVRTLEPGRHTEKANSSVLAYIKNPCMKTLKMYKFYNTDTWNKMVSLEFIRKNNILWEENCRVNVDVLYSYLIALKAYTSLVLPNVIYWFVGSPDSITRKVRTTEREFQFYLAAQKRNGFFKKIGYYYPFYRKDILYIIFMAKKRGFKGMLDFFRYRYLHINEVREAQMKFLPYADIFDSSRTLSLETNIIIK